MSEEENEVIIRYATAFGEYVKAMDPELWKRAREYALDYEANGNGVKLIKADPEKKDDDNE
jgi:hypothetical protein